VRRGETLTVMGPSGSGKSTLLAYLGGFLDPVFTASGRVIVDGVDLTGLEAERRHAGILFQDPLLFPHFSVADNIAIAIPETCAGRKQRRAMAEAALEDAGLAGFGDSDPDTLSGGQKARVALQRVLAVATAAVAARRTVLQARCQSSGTDPADGFLQGAAAPACRWCWSPMTKPMPVRPEKSTG
jgi:ABC-type uncharacterized transport system YnjBCD ATPase subunit